MKDDHEMQRQAIYRLYTFHGELKFHQALLLKAESNTFELCCECGTVQSFNWRLLKEYGVKDRTIFQWSCTHCGKPLMTANEETNHHD